MFHAGYRTAGEVYHRFGISDCNLELIQNLKSKIQNFSIPFQGVFEEEPEEPGELFLVGEEAEDAP